MGTLQPPLIAQAEQAAQTLAPSGGGEFFLFWILGPLALASALGVILVKRPVHAALCLVVNFFCVAAFYFALGGQFLGTMQITVYAGAVVILFLFVIMLLGVESEGAGVSWRNPRHIAAALGSGALFVGLAGPVLAPWMGIGSACNTSEAVSAAAAANPAFACKGISIDQGQAIHDLGFTLFTDYVWPFEVMAVLLTVAAVGALIIGRFNEKPEDLVEFGYAAAPGEPLPHPGEIIIDDEVFDDFDDLDDDPSTALEAGSTPARSTHEEDA